MYYDQGYRSDSYSGSRPDAYVIDYNGSRGDRNSGQSRGIGYESGERSNDSNKGGSKHGKRAKKALKKLKKLDMDFDDDRQDDDDERQEEADAGVEKAPDGGVNAVVVCGGSVVLTTAYSVVRVSVHESIDSLNNDFNDSRIGDSSNCTDGIRSNFDAIFGEDPTGRELASNCLAQEDSYRCLMSNFFEVASSSFPSENSDSYPTYVACMNKGNLNFFPCLYYNFPGFNEQPGYRLIAQYCSYLWNSSDINVTSSTASRLTAGNVFSASVSADDDEFGTTLNYIFLAVSLFCVLLGAIISVFTGYRITGILGSLLVAVGFIVASFISEDDEVIVEVLVGGVAGIGSAFLRVSAIIAVLEYFQDLRMRAIVLSGLGAVLINFLMIGLTFIDTVDFDWRTIFKYQAIPAGLSLIASFFMKPLKLKSEDRRDRSGVSCSTKCSDYVFSRDLFSDVVLYLIMFLFLLDQIGRPIFSEGMQPYLEEKKFTETQVDIQPFIENGGSLLGLLALLFWRRQNLADNLTVMAAMDILVGILALHVPELTVYAWAVAYSAIFGFTDAVFASMIQDAIPEGFSRRHIRMVAGLLGLVAGIGLVVSGFVADAIEKHADGKHVAYYFSGGCMIAAGLLSVVSRVVVVRKQTNAERRYMERNEMEFSER